MDVVALADLPRPVLEHEIATLKNEREALTRNLKEELEGGMLWLDERKGLTRVVIPEEVLFSPTGSSTCTDRRL